LPETGTHGQRLRRESATTHDAGWEASRTGRENATLGVDE